MKNHLLPWLCAFAVVISAAPPTGASAQPEEPAVLPAPAAGAAAPVAAAGAAAPAPAPAVPAAVVPAANAPAAPAAPDAPDAPVDTLVQAIQNDDMAAAKAVLAANPKVLSSWASYGTSPLQSAIQTGKTEWVKFLLDAGADPNAFGMGYSELPIGLAMDSGQNGNWKDMVDLLLSKGARVNAVDSQGGTVLQRLIGNGPNGSLDKIQYLLDKGADVSVRTQEGFNAVQLALNGQATDVFQAILAKSDLNTRDSEGDTLLHLAVQRGNVDIIRILLAKGIDINARNNVGDTPLHLAAATRSSLIKILLDAGANPNLANFKGDLPLHIALRASQAPYAIAEAPAQMRRFGPMLRGNRMFMGNQRYYGNAAAASSEEDVTPRGGVLAPLTEKSDINAIDGFGMTPLLIAILARDQESRDLIHDRNPHMDATTEFFDAVSQGNVESVQSFLTQKPYLVTLRASDGSTPLHVAARWGTLGVATLLVAHGADVNARDAEGRTPLIRSLTHATGLFLHRAKAMEAFLLEHGAEVNAFDTDDDNALLEAVRSNEIDLVQPLLDKGARPDATDAIGNTPLMEALAPDGDRGIVDALLAKGPSVNLQDQSGTTALMLAAQRANLSLVQTLLDQGADVQIRDHQGQSALTLVVSSGSTSSEVGDIAALLISKGADPNQKWSGQSLFGRVLQGGGEMSTDLAKIFLATKKIDVNEHQMQGSYLMGAVSQQRPELVQMLLDAGADPNEGGQQGTPLSVAKDNQNQAIIAMLVAKGAK